MAEDTVQKAVLSRAEPGDMELVQQAAGAAEAVFEPRREELVAALTVLAEASDSAFIKDRLKEAAELELMSPNSFIDFRRPKGTIASRDSLAASQGLRVPPHIQVQAVLEARLYSFTALEALGGVARRTRLYLGQNGKGPARVGSPTRVFIGHGGSPVWRELKEFVESRLGLKCVEFNTQSAAGLPTTQRLEDLLNESRFAFLIMTGEDEHADKLLHARENVIHEVGLFQGRLGFRRAIVLVEEGCQEFSNIHGLGQVRFPPGEVRATFEDIRRVLEREGVLPQPNP